MKLDRGLKIVLILLLIVLISIISFAGIYVQEKKSMVNVLADYKLGMDLKGSRTITVIVDDSKKTVYYDKDGKVVESEDKNGSKEEVPVNSKDALTKENYLKTKTIIEKRLNDLGIEEYLIRQNEDTGRLTVQIPEDDSTDMAIQYLYTTGKFSITDEDGTVLLDNSNIKNAKVAYNTTQSGTTVYLNIQFNKDSVEKLKEITNNHLKTTDSEGKDISKKITMKLDDTDLISTSFEEEVTNGVLSLSVGTASTSSSDLSNYLKEASNISIFLNNEPLPIKYSVDQNRYVLSDITEKTIETVGIVAGGVLVLACIVLTIVYKKNGLLAGIANIGYVAVLLIIIRYTNVIITTEGLFGILISVILNYIFSIYLLKMMKNKEITVGKAYNKTVLAMLFVLIPALAVGVTLCFANWMPIYSFGEIIFWGILLIFIYNTVLTRTLLMCSTKKQSMKEV